MPTPPPSPENKPRRGRPPKRHDPVSRVVDGDINESSAWTNLDPDRHYVEANPNDDRCGVMHMQQLGYEVETARADGPRMKGGKAASDGSQLTRYGQVLMSCPGDEYQARQRATWAVADQRSKAIGQKGGVDGIRGPVGPLAQHTADPTEHFGA